MAALLAWSPAIGEEDAPGETHEDPAKKKWERQQVNSPKQQKRENIPER